MDVLILYIKNLEVEIFFFFLMLKILVLLNQLNNTSRKRKIFLVNEQYLMFKGRKLENGYSLHDFSLRRE